MGNLIITAYENLISYTKELFMLDLTTIILSGITTFLGALAAFKFNESKEKKKNENIEKEQLIIYFRNLNFLIRNIGIFSKNVNVVMSNFIKAEYQRQIPLENLKFDFGENEISFVCKNSPLLYEGVLQLKIEFNRLLEISKKYNRTIKMEDIKEVYVNITSFLPKWDAMFENIDNYLIKHYNNKSLIVGKIKNNKDSIVQDNEIYKSTKQGWLIEDKDL